MMGKYINNESFSIKDLYDNFYFINKTDEQSEEIKKFYIVQKNGYKDIAYKKKEKGSLCDEWKILINEEEINLFFDKLICETDIENVRSGYYFFSILHDLDRSKNLFDRMVFLNGIYSKIKEDAYYNVLSYVIIEEIYSVYREIIEKFDYSKFKILFDLYDEKKDIYTSMYEKEYDRLFYSDEYQEQLKNIKVLTK